MTIKLFSKAHYELMAQFESLKPGRIDRENKELWKQRTHLLRWNG